MSRLLAAITLVTALAAGAQPAYADLHYTVHMEARPISGTAAPATPGVLLQMLVPNGPADVVCWVGANGIRAELSKRMGALAAGSVLVKKPDGTGVVMNPADQTYWKTPQDRSTASAGASAPKFAPTGQTITIAGIKSERVARDVGAASRGSSAAQGMELWIARQFRQYASAGVQANPLLSVLELGDAVQQGFVMRALVRGPGFGTSEMEFVVTSIKEDAAPGGAYEIPKGYREVPAPVPLPAGR